ncbi:hypothetical protein CC2G_005549 [Coprinopsis cinerea AmutBmut pab1-1]|nr:hypothetical protein CC2G_005549 [Coprinopsis cinerea AmutBmut pab1-1]
MPTLTSQITPRNATSRVLECLELLDHIASFLPWKHMSALAASHPMLRSVTQVEAEKRIRIGLEPILGALELSFESFMNALDECEGGFVGSTALRVMYVRTEYLGEYARMPRITVVVPKGKRERFIELLDKPSWVWVEKPIGWQSRETISKVVEANVTSATQFLGDDEVQQMVPEPEDPEERGNDYVIQSRVRRRERLKYLVYFRILESTAHVLQVLGGSDSTRDMIVITSTRIYLLYPKLVHADLALTGSWGWERGSRIKSVPVVHKYNESWPFPCGKLCPVLARKGREGDGTGVFYWNGERERALIREAEEWVKTSGWGAGWRISDDEGSSNGREDRIRGRGSLWSETSVRAAELLRGGCLFDRSDFKLCLKTVCCNPRCSSGSKVAVYFRRL